MKSRIENSIFLLILAITFASVNILTISLDKGNELSAKNSVLIMKELADFEKLNDGSDIITLYNEADIKTLYVISDLININNYFKSTYTLRSLAANIITVLSILIIPFMQFLFIRKRGYELGVQRALGMGKHRVWLRLLCENALITAVAVFMSLLVILIGNRRLLHTVLGLESEMEALILREIGDEVFVRGFEIFTASGMGSVLFMACLSLMLLSLLTIRIINRNTPLKLIADHK
jgi:ABC-type antimicrobial peptide transport system permease subunit